MEEAANALHKTRASKRKYHFIYKTTCLVTGRWYIGMHSTDVVEDGYLGSGKRLWYSIEKHGKENHVREIVEFCEDRKALAAREKEIVNEEMLKEELCMNLTEGGGDFGEAASRRGGTSSLAKGNGFRNRGFFEKTVLSRKKLHASKWENDLEYHKGFSERQSARNKGNTYWLGRKHSSISKAKISASMQGKQSDEKNSNFGKRNKCVSKDGVTKRIPLDEVETYLANGWVLGIKKCGTK